LNCSGLHHRLRKRSKQTCRPASEATYIPSTYRVIRHGIEHAQLHFFFYSIMQFFKIWFSKFLKILKDHIFQILEIFCTRYFISFLWWYKLLFLKWEFPFSTVNYLIDIFFWKIWRFRIKIHRNSFWIILCVLRIKSLW